MASAPFAEATPETAVAPPAPAVAPPASAAPTRLHLTNVRKSFGGRKVVDIADLALGRHGIEGLIGPNGAGKTTLMNLVTQKLRLDAGTVHYSPNGDGSINITGMSVDRVARLGVVKTNQVIRDFDGLTIRDSLLLSLARRGSSASISSPARSASGARPRRRSTSTSTTSTSRTPTDRPCPPARRSSST